MNEAHCTRIVQLLVIVGNDDLKGVLISILLCFSYNNVVLSLSVNEG